jgi:pimeloyl-ACP methyl ester carboxylesterase
LPDLNRLTISGAQLEYVWHGPGPALAPTLVFLHEGLGCVAMWRDFPARLAAATGFGALVYSRAGYGNSDPVELPRSVRFMYHEALVTLPLVLDALAIRQAILVGHSDGGSIASIHAGGVNEQRVLGLILEAPHVFVEEVGLESIRGIAEEYRESELDAPAAAASGLKQRLARYHGENVDAMFWGWNDVWLNPEFRTWNIEEYLSLIAVPLLLIQGVDDQYGTLAQVQAIEAGCRKVQTVVLADCGHSPHLDQPALTLDAMKKFVADLRGSLEFRLQAAPDPA